MNRLPVVMVVLAACGKIDSKAAPDAPASHADAPGQHDGPAQRDAAVDAGPWTPARLPGIVVWLSADQGVTTSNSHVSTWLDRSGMNNNAAQLTAARQPTLVTGAMNGQPVVRFDGATSAMQITDSSTLQWGTDDFTIELVASWTNPTTGTFPYGLLVAKQNQAAPYAGPSLWANFPTPSVDSVLGVQLDTTHYVRTAAHNLNDGNPRVYGGRRYGGTNLESRVDGAVDQMATLAAATDISAAGSPMFIGGQIKPDNSLIQQLHGDIAEVVIVHGSITPADLAQLESYLKTKYAL